MSDDNKPGVLAYAPYQGSIPSDLSLSDASVDSLKPPITHELYCAGSSKQSNLPDLQSLHRQAARPKCTTWLLPRLLIIIVMINDKPCCALLDSGSLMDFIFSTIVDQLQLKYDLLEKPILLQLAFSGSHSVVKAYTSINLKYQEIPGPCTFNIVNLESYDVILGMPFLFQHQILLGFNPPEIKICSIEPLPI